VFALIELLFDIIRLRRGPDAIPYSRFLFVLIVGLWLFAGMVMTVMTPELDEKDFLIGTVAGIAGVLCYAAVVVFAGKGARLLQAIMALLGCGALLSLGFVAANVFLTPFLSASITNLIVTLILLWSVPVEGHIIARTIDRHWYIGVVIAMTVFIFQLVLYSVIDPTAGTTA